MEFRFEKSNCVAVGTFNIYIVQPHLLAQMGVIADSTEVEIAGDLTQPGIRFRYDDSVWIARPERLSVESTNPAFDCGCCISETLRNLQWTPIMAIGVNATFQSNDSDSDLPELFRAPNPPIDGIVQRTCHVDVKEGNVTMNIQLVRREGVLELSVNAHTEVKKSKMNQSETNRVARSACDSFFQHRDRSVEIARSILGGSFIYEPAHVQ